MEENKLKKALTAAGIWSVAVGAVISGSYYGWNYIASETNFTGCLIAMAIATLFYIPFAFMFAELATAIPSSAGPAAYTEKAFGRGAGFFAGFSYLVESLFCTPGICIAVGAYVHTLFPVVPAVVASVVAYLIFLFINMRGIEAGQLIGLIVTVIGVAGVVFYACIGLPHADFSLLGKMGDLGGVKGIFVAIPYAVWFYLAFEAGGMGAEECKNPSKDIPKGFIVGIFTLLIGGMLMLVTTFSLLPKEELLKNDAPIANVINHLFGEGSTMSIVFIVIAMIGLIASLNGIIIGQSRQTTLLLAASACPASLASSIRTAPRSTHFSLPPSSASSLPSSARLTLSLLSQTWVPHSWLFAASSPGSSSQRISRICLAPTSAPVGSATSAFPSALSLRSARCTAQ